MKFLHVISAALLLNSPDVSGFSNVKPLGFRSNTLDATSRQIGGQVVSGILPVQAAQSPLFMGKKDSEALNRRAKIFYQSLAELVANLLSFRANLGRKLRRAVVVAWTAAFIFMVSSGLNVQPAHASTMAPQEPVQERILSATSPSLDKIVDRYVKNHMFEDDTYDPVESLYREAYQDATQGSYPRALKEVTASVLGQESSKGMIEKSDGNAFGSLLTSALGMLKKRGLSEGAAIAVVAASFVVAGPFAFLVGGMVIGGASKRNMNKVMKKRYGDTYTVDATIKTEEDVEAPDDDDDDDEDDDEDDDKDDDDEDDDEKE
eukprot:scaffold11454_cov168-Amphora_coffeaeformis.AAC.2